MRDRIQSLQNNAYIFGPNLTFQWTPNTPTEAQDPSLLPFTARTRSTVQTQQSVVANFWQSGQINIYFCGNVQPNPSIPMGALAASVDPQQASQWTPPLPRIFLNDGGFALSSGFDPIFTPELMTSYFAIEHEMAHYLGRFTNRSFGQPPNQRVYDAGEHVPNGQNNILELSAPPALPLVVPGRWNQSGTENKEIWDRISAGNWNNP